MDRSHLNQKDMKIANCLQASSQKMFKVSTICTDACLEVLSSLVNCSVNNVESEIRPWAYLAQLQSFKSVKDSE